MSSIGKSKIPLVRSLREYFSYHPELDHGTTLDSIDFYFYVLKLESMVDGNMYIYVHHPGQLIRNMRYIYKIRHFTGISRNNTNNRLVLDINYVKIVKNRNDAESQCDDSLHNDDFKWFRY